MAQVQTQSFTTMLQNYAATVQGACSAAVNFTIGSVFRALGEACAAIGLWLQGLILQMLTLARASTSTGTDLDSWLADFGFSRLAPIAASGPVTFSRFTASQQAVIPVGAVVQTADGSEQYQVIADTTNPAYSASLSGFVVAAGVSSVTCTVVSITAGNNSQGLPDSSGNVVAGAISQMAQAISGIDTVTNAAPFQNGQDSESDTAALTRFQSWLASLGRGTKAAIMNAVQALGANFVCTYTENVDFNGNPKPGYFYVVVDDGSGNPPSQTLNNVAAAVEAVRGDAITYNIYGPSIVSVSVSMSITTASGYTHATVAATVALALQAYIDALPLGTALPYSKLAAVAYGAQVGAVTNVSNVLLNGGTADVSANASQVIKYTTVTVN